MERDWKLITVYVGLNDLCASCYDVEKYSSFAYVTNIGRALDILKDKVPRAFVNVIPAFDVSVLRNMDADNDNCKNMRSETCPCIVNKDDASLVSELSQRYQDQLAAEIDGGKYDTDTFAVVLQKQLENLNFLSLSDGRPDPTLLSHDCTLLSREGHQKTAIALWNSMGTYFYTNLNSEPVYLEVDLEEAVKYSTKMEKSRDKLHAHPYYAVIFITVFIFMIALVAAVIIHLTIVDFKKEKQIKMYDFSLFADDDDD
ncbi:phospholipase B1, membrane-associated-like [Anneissia japonica]|uniref:phospholipase B1, membrane-associated-like n=1 Tax=Anneissia japonica TaxID=1529436 RepID=UPI001425A478|nr:phospholipase B1, membrane-associated-like [Anneissia japonica]